MGPLLVVFGAKAIEARLLRLKVGGGRAGDLGFQRPVHPLVAAALFGMRRVVQRRSGAEPAPARREPGRGAQGRRRERHSIVGADDPGEPKFLKGAAEDWARRRDRGRAATLTRE